jgi:imidazolonepropionase
VNDRVWLNANLATLNGGEAFGAIADGALAVREGRIAWLGARSDLPAEWRSAEVSDAQGAWITPGLIDCHTHLVYAGNRAAEFGERLAGRSYAEIAAQGGGILATVRATRAADEETLFAASARRLETLAAEGVTTVEIKSGYGLELAAEAKMLRVARRLGERFGLRLRTSFLGAHALPPEFAHAREAYLDSLCEEMLPALAGAGLIDAVDAFCERIAFSAAETRRVFAAAVRFGLPVKLHADQLSDGGGAALAAEFKALSADHLEYANEAGIKAMARAGTVAVLLPGAFYFLREKQLPPIAALRAAGVPMAIATDANPGSSPCTSLLLMLNMACTLFGLTPQEALAGVTCHAARALGLGDQCGRLAVGLAADFVLWDIDSPIDLVYAMGANPCRQIVIAGSPAPSPQAGEGSFERRFATHAMAKRP